MSSTPTGATRVRPAGPRGRGLDPFRGAQRQGLRSRRAPTPARLARRTLSAGLAVVVAAALLGTVAAGTAGAQTGEAGSFDDDAGSVYEPALDALAGRGHLAGTECGPRSICPDEPISRWEMAVWLVRVLDDAEPDAVESVRFADVDADAWWSPHAERLFDLEVTRGCGTAPLTYCPADAVKRGEMAAFLVRAFDLPAGGPVGFEDMAGHFHAESVNALTAAGITAGCAAAPLRFCPQDQVTRGQMALFLARAMDLIGLPSTVRFSAVAVGSYHACGLQVDETVTCWGENGAGQADALDGTFASVSAGFSHSCGLRSDETIACWGDNSLGQSTPREGRYRSVAAGGWHSCGLQSDETVECWGNNNDGQSEPPEREFSAIAAGGHHSCGLQSDGTIACWGSNSDGQIDAPTGSFSAVVAGDRFSCGLRNDSRVVCWGGNNAGQTQAPAGMFTSITAGGWHSCGLSNDMNLTCWGDNAQNQSRAPKLAFTAVSAGYGLSCGVTPNNHVACWGDVNEWSTSAPDGDYRAVDVGESHMCALDTDDSISCWGSNRYGQADPIQGRYKGLTSGASLSCGILIDDSIECWGAFGEELNVPDGLFNELSAGRSHVCGLRDDNAIVCWGQDHNGQTDAPDGQFSAVAAGEWHSCALHTDATIVCWGANWSGQASPPDGQFTAVTAGQQHSCGLQADNTVACWGSNMRGQMDSPDGQFLAVSAGSQHSCALRDDRTIVCWGSNDEGQAVPPDGEFSTVAAGYRHSCGIDIGGKIVCWGKQLVVPTPIGTTRVTRASLADPTACRPYGVSHGITAGFPLPHWAAAATGTINVAVLFVDFPDATALHTTEEEAALGLSFISRYINAVSYGRLRVEFTPLHGWLRTSNDFRRYSALSGSVWTVIPLIDGEAVQLADPNFDFTGYDSVLIVMPSSHFGGGTALGYARSDEGYVGPIARINNHSLDSRRDPFWWGSVGAHELVHTLGLLDLYSYDQNRESVTSGLGNVIADAEFGLMSMHAFFETSANDRRLAHTWVHPDGYRSTAYQLHTHAIEMLAWSRWQLGWLDPAQIRCVTEPEQVVALRPIAAPPGDSIAMAAVPLSDTEAIVVESRRKIGYDAGLEHREPDGTYTTFPALAVEGVLVYTVDSSIGSGELPIKVAGDDGNGRVADYPVLTVGQSVTVRGYTITVTSDDGTTHTVTITKIGGA